MAVSEDDVRSLIRLFEETGWDELRLEVGDFRLVLGTRLLSAAPEVAPRGGAASARAEVPAAAPPAASPVDVALGEGHAAIRAPNLGTFWRQPKPGAPPYVELGQHVELETEVCLIEVMKLFTPVQAGVAGKIVEVCAEDGQMVEYDAPLFVIDTRA